MMKEVTFLPSLNRHYAVVKHSSRALIMSIAFGVMESEPKILGLVISKLVSNIMSCCCNAL